MTLAEYRGKYRAMAMSDVRKLAEKDSAFREETERLHKQITHTPLNKGCGECWVDAYAVLMRIDDGEFKKISERKFDLKAGALLIDPVTGDNSKLCTRKNLTDELAIYHLRANPKCIKKFSKYPENWQELVEIPEAIQNETKPKKKEGKKKKVTKPAK